jgi:tellurite methyltransferase
MKQKNNWDLYYKNISNEKPREILVKALALIPEDMTGYAVDLGCGNGIDTIELLKRGWKVLAVDKEKNALSMIKKCIDKTLKTNLQTKQEAFEKLKIPSCDLINANYSHPFCRPDYFLKFWENIVSSIKTKGWFSGNLFGNNDEWSENKSMTFFTKDQVLSLFSYFKIEYFLEVEEYGMIADG